MEVYGIVSTFGWEVNGRGDLFLAGREGAQTQTKYGIGMFLSTSIMERQMMHLISFVDAHSSHGRLRQILDPLLDSLLLDGWILGDSSDLPSRILTGIRRGRFENMIANDVVAGGTTATASAMAMEGGVDDGWLRKAADDCGWAVLAVL